MRTTYVTILIFLCAFTLQAQKIKIKKEQLYVDKVHYGKMVVEELGKGKKKLILENTEGKQVVVVEPKQVLSPIYHDDKTYEYIEISFPTEEAKVGLKKEELRWSRDEVIKFLAGYSVMSAGSINIDGVDALLSDHPHEVPIDIKETAEAEMKIFETAGKMIDRDSSKEIFVVFSRTNKKNNKVYASHYTIIQDKVTIGKAIAETPVGQMIPGRNQNKFKPTADSEPKVFFYAFDGLPVGSLEIGDKGVLRTYLPFKIYGQNEANYNDESLNLLQRIAKAAQFFVTQGNL